MRAKHLRNSRKTRKTALYMALLGALLVAGLRPVFGAILPAIRIRAQLLGMQPPPPRGPSSVTRVVVRHSRGLSGINLTCSLLGCQVVQSINDPDGQLFVVQSSGLLSSALFLTQLLSVDGVINAESDQIVKSPSAPMDSWPSTDTLNSEQK